MRAGSFAAIYGNEVACGKALKKVLDSGKVKREELFIVSKLWATDWHQVDAACSKSLAELQLDYGGWNEMVYSLALADGICSTIQSTCTSSIPLSALTRRRGRTRWVAISARRFRITSSGRIWRG